MSRKTQILTMPRRAAAVGALALALSAVSPASAAVPLQIASDPYTQATCAGSTTTNHHANVEPDSFSNGSTVVSAYQVGRIYDGGACAIGFSTSFPYKEGAVPCAASAISARGT